MKSQSALIVCACWAIGLAWAGHPALGEEGCAHAEGNARYLGYIRPGHSQSFTM